MVLLRVYVGRWTYLANLKEWDDIILYCTYQERRKAARRRVHRMHMQAINYAS